MDKIMEVLLLLVLIIASVDDIRTRQIHLIYVWGFLLGALAAQILSPTLTWASFLGGIGFGVALYISCSLDKRIMGSGDAWILSLCGAYLGLGETLMVFCRAIMAAGLWGIVMLLKYYLVSGKPRRRLELPFVPFLLCGYLTVFIRYI